MADMDDPDWRLFVTPLSTVLTGTGHRGAPFLHFYRLMEQIMVLVHYLKWTRIIPLPLFK